MSAVSLAGFYITGGTVPRDAPCYVDRQADIDLLEGLRQGQFCYVLTPRQMGKSSLMVRTATRLREEGVTCVILDLTAIGQNLDAERWYGGLLNQLGQHINLEDELDNAWLAASSLGPMQRWMQCLQLVLKRRMGSLVIFVDEIDAVRSLPFSADEFFAGIRECYNRRTENPDFNRVAFCLLGVATPADLIRDTHTTPFNIGRRIELADFTFDEAKVLALGLGYRLDGDYVYLQASESRALLRRVLYWTGGHPYLTQRLCKALGESTAALRPTDQLVDRLCRELFLEAGARDRDDNLIFVRERLLRNPVDLAGLLLLYRKVREAKPIRVDETDPLAGALRLSGIARVSKGRLRVRNRIYDRVFDERWIQANMPGAELRRQKAAYRKGLLRGSIVIVSILSMAGLAAYALLQRQEWIQEVSKEQQQTARARDGMSLLLYISNMNSIQQSWEVRPIRMAGVLELLETTRLSKFRGIEWGIWYRRCHPELRTFNVTKDGVAAVAFSPDGRHLLTSGNGTATLWDVRTGTRIRAVKHGATVTAVAFSPDGKWLLTAGEDSSARIWDVTTGLPRAVLTGHGGYVTSAAFSPDGRRIVTASLDNTARIWDAATGKVIRILKEHRGYVSSAAFSSDGSRLVTGSVDTTARIWDPAAGKQLRVVTGHAGPVYSAALSPDARWLVTGNRGETATLWPPGSGKPFSLKHAGAVTSTAFSPNGRLLLTGSKDTTAKLWDAKTGKELRVMLGHQKPVTCVVFSPDGKYFATGSRDGSVKLWRTDSGPGDPARRISVASKEQQSVKLWDAMSGRMIRSLTGQAGRTTSVAFSPDGKFILSAGYDDTAELWDAASTRIVHRLGGQQSLQARQGPDSTISSIAFSPDSKQILTGSVDETARIWSTASGQETGSLKGHTGPVSAVAFSPDGKHILTASRDGIGRLWNAAKPQEQPLLFKGHAGPISSAAFSPSGKFILTGSEDANALLWDTDTRRLVYRFAGQSGPISSAAFSRDGSRILTGSWDHSVWLWDANSGKVIRKIEAGLGPVFSVAFSPDGSQIIAGGEARLRGEAAIWDTRSGRQIRRLEGASSPVAFSPDGTRIATGSRSATANRYDKSSFGTTGIAMLIAKANAGPISDVAFSPDGKHILTGSRDFTATLWDRANPGRTKVLRGHTAAVSSVAFSPDGTRLLTGSEDGTVKLWESTTGTEILTLKANLGAIASVEFSPDGGSILARSADNASMLWSAR